jgi:formylglycine-generating enzyme required for sulfatase activity
VDWSDACAFAVWADALLRSRGVLKKGEQVRLPTEPEWERAAAYPCVVQPGSSASVRRRYPWGNSFDLNNLPANTKEAGIGGPSVVGIFPHGAADCGAEDLAGNVWEWCSTRYQSYPLPAGLKAETIDTLPEESRGVLRGGSYSLERMFARCAFRTDGSWYDIWYDDGGLRLARLFSS